MADIKRMSAAEFRELGYLQEVNRRFLHPLGLALEVEGDDKTGEITGFGEVWDYRDDPEGMCFADGMIDGEKAKRIERERSKLAVTRYKALGYEIQPATGLVPDDDEGVARKQRAADEVERAWHDGVAAVRRQGRPYE